MAIIFWPNLLNTFLKSKISKIQAFSLIFYYRVGRSSLDYGHFAKKVCETSDIEFLRKHSHAMVFAVDMSILAYQLGMCSVAILFISDNMVSNSLIVITNSEGIYQFPAYESIQSLIIMPKTINNHYKSEFPGQLVRWPDWRNLGPETADLLDNRPRFHSADQLLHQHEDRQLLRNCLHCLPVLWFFCYCSIHN